MNRGKLLLRNLLYHRRMNLCVALGAALATAILVGALGTGDSVRASLRKHVRQRLGRVEYALAAGDRTVRSALADAMARAGTYDVAAVFQTRGSIDRLPVDVLGVDQEFWALGHASVVVALPGPGQAVLNERLANHLGVGVGDSILVRVDAPSLLPRELALSPARVPTLGLRVTVSAIAGAEAFGAFQLWQAATPAYNVFVSRAWLVEELGLEDRANLLLAGKRLGAVPSSGGRELADALRTSWTASDASLQFKRRDGERGVELTSRRIFIDPQIVEAAREEYPEAQPVVSYLVNAIRVGPRSIPYSFASAPGPEALPMELGTNQVLLNAWAADDLGARVGDAVDLVYYVPGPLRSLVEPTQRFELAGIVPMSSPVCDRTLVPDLPGISDAETCADWDPGIPIALDQIRPEDESYWTTYRGTPKVFLSTSAATQLWQNRYGTYTAIRFEGTNTAVSLANGVMHRLSPDALGLHFDSVGMVSGVDGGGSVDFGQLFLSLSFFILAAALLLTGLLFIFSIQSRAVEVGTLLALGWEKRAIRTLLSWEGALLAATGSALGVWLGVGYHRGILRALTTVWRGAVASADIEAVIQRETLWIGWAVGFVVSFAVLAIALRSVTAQDPARLVAHAVPAARRRTSVVVALVAGVLALGVLVGFDAGRGQQVAGIFFGAGSLLLVAFLAVWSLVFAPGRGGQVNRSRKRFTQRALMLRGCRLRQGRTMAAVALLAAGIFVVVAVGANRHATVMDPQSRAAGTGGFAFFVQAAVPIVHDLNTTAGRREVGLQTPLAERLRFVQMRLMEGDDASCLNLDRVVRPQVLGVDPTEFDRRGAFSFATLAPGVGEDHPWMALDDEVDSGTIPAVADQTVITWSLNKKVGDLIPLKTSDGAEVRLQLIGGLRNSVLQGNVVVSERMLRKHFPGMTGSRVLLVDAPADHRTAVEGELQSAFRNHGVTLTATVDRLSQFSVVQDTYLGIFLVLGGMGVILGTAGVGVVLLRNMLERRRELGILRAIGFTRGELFRYVMGEHALILLGGVLCGVPAALIAVLPSLATAGRSIPWLQLDMVAGMVIVSALLFITVATIRALHGNVIQALREE